MIIKLEPYKRKKQKPKIKSEFEEAINNLETFADAATWRVEIQLDRPEETVYEFNEWEPHIQETE